MDNIREWSHNRHGECGFGRSGWNDEIDNALKTSAGLGLRIKTAMGMIRLDAAKTGGHSAKYMFGFGQAF